MPEVDVKALKGVENARVVMNTATNCCFGEIRPSAVKCLQADSVVNNSFDVRLGNIMAEASMLSESEEG